MSYDRVLCEAMKGWNLSNSCRSCSNSHRYVYRVSLVIIKKSILFLLVSAMVVFSLSYHTSFLPFPIFPSTSPSASGISSEPLLKKVDASRGAQFGIPIMEHEFLWSQKSNDFILGSMGTQESRERKTGASGNSSGADSLVKIIEFTTPLYTNLSWSVHLGEAFDLSSCPESRCRFVLYPHRHPHPDAKVFQALHFEPSHIPKTRTANQVMIWMTLEAASMRAEQSSLRERLRMANNLGNNRFFNMTMTFHQLSDVTFSYGHFKSLLGEPLGPIPSLLNIHGPTFRSYVEALKNEEVVRMALREDHWEKLWGRPRMAAWLVSHCSTDSGREFYVEELQKYIEVDVMGNCGKFQCGATMNERCYQKVLLPKYKFYLAFENNMCTDYITEKPYRALMHGMVPIVFGGANYSQYLPPGSYIDATPLKPQALAQVILEVASSPESYGRFHLWRRFWKVGLFPPLCQLCEKLHRIPLHHHSPLHLQDFPHHHPPPSSSAPSKSVQNLGKTNPNKDGLTVNSPFPSPPSSNPSSPSFSSSSSLQPQHPHPSPIPSSSRSSSSLSGLPRQSSAHRGNASYRSKGVSASASAPEKKKPTLWSWWVSVNRCYTIFPQSQFKRPQEATMTIQFNFGVLRNYVQKFLKDSVKGPLSPKEAN